MCIPYYVPVAVIIKLKYLVLSMLTILKNDYEKDQESGNDQILNRFKITFQKLNSTIP